MGETWQGGFSRFLNGQIGRDDLIGDLAKDVSNDEQWPGYGSYGCFNDYLKSRNACDGAIKALHDAYKEYTKPNEDDWLDIL